MADTENATALISWSNLAIPLDNNCICKQNKNTKNTAVDKTRNKTAYNVGGDFESTSRFERVEVRC